MRVTNGMIRNNMLNALNVNMQRLDKLNLQMNTQKKVQRPSDDPIVTGRALKLRVNVYEIEQYKSNTEEATSWMDITEAALGNIHKILKDIRTRCNQAANGVFQPEDRDKIKEAIDQMWNQLQDEANVTYLGRYVFSGYKTDEPVIIQKETKLDAATNVVGEITLPKDTYIPAPGILLPDGTTYTLPAPDNSYPVTLTKDYKLPVTAITDPGTLSKDIALAEPLTLTADITNGKVIMPDGTVKTASVAAPIKSGTVLPKGATIKSGTDIPNGHTIQVGVTLPKDTILLKGTINPKVLGKVEGQQIEYQVGVGSNIVVNTLGMDSAMNKILADVKDIKDKLYTYYDGITGNEADLYALFNEKIGEFDKSLSTISKMTADLGSRALRMEYTHSRLTDDKTNFSELLLNTEGVDLEEVYVQFNAQYQVYLSALQATSKVTMNTLADFLR